MRSGRGPGGYFIPRTSGRHPCVERASRMTKPLPQLRLQKRCPCGQPAVTARTIRRYCVEGRLEPLWASHFLRRADRPPPEPLCVHHMVRSLTILYGLIVRQTFWGGRLSRWPRNAAALRHRRPCQARRTNGSPCCAPAKRDSPFCYAHEPRPWQPWSLRPRQMGRRCEATSVTTRMRCRNTPFSRLSINARRRRRRRCGGSAQC
jgi:hypothetical protein